MEIKTMKILPQHNPVRLSSEPTHFTRRPERNGDSFLQVLNQVSIPQAEKECRNKELPMDKEKLQLFVRLLRMQSNRRLINAVPANDAGGNEWGGTYLGSARLSLINGLSNFFDSLSKFQHARSEDVAKTVGVVTDTTKSDSDNLQIIIDKAAATYKVDSGLIKAVIKAESGFNARAVSPKGAMGLMQLMPETAKDLGVKDPYHPEENVMAGTRYLKGLLDRYHGDVDQALAAYNWGMGNVERNPDRLPKETRNYVAQVNRHYRG